MSQIDENENFDTGYHRVDVQVQTASGYWTTVRTINYVNDQYIYRQLEFVKNSKPRSGVRAMYNGQIIGILP